MPTATMAVVHRLFAPAVRSAFRVEAGGRGYVPGRGGVLLAANHRSFLDHFVLAAACPRPLWFVGKAELNRGAAGAVNRALGMVPIERGAADLRALDIVVALLRRGEAVGIFPEGTRSRSGELFRFRSGLARIAAAAEAPVVPVGLCGTAAVWPPGAALPRVRAPSPVTVSFGEVVPAPAATPAARRSFTEEVYDRIAALCGQPPAVGFAPLASSS